MTQIRKSRHSNIINCSSDQTIIQESTGSDQSIRSFKKKTNSTSHVQLFLKHSCLKQTRAFLTGRHSTILKKNQLKNLFFFSVFSGRLKISRENGLGLPLRQKAVIGQISGGVKLFVEVAVLGLNGVRSQKNRSFGRTVDFVRKDRILHLQVKESNGYVLNELLGHVLRVKLGAKFKLKRTLLLDVLIQHLSTTTTVFFKMKFYAKLC